MMFCSSGAPFKIAEKGIFLPIYFYPFSHWGYNMTFVAPVQLVEGNTQVSSLAESEGRHKSKKSPN